MLVKFQVQQCVVGVVLLVKCGDMKMKDLKLLLKLMVKLMSEKEFEKMVFMFMYGKLKYKYDV